MGNLLIIFYVSIVIAGLLFVPVFIIGMLISSKEETNEKNS